MANYDIGKLKCQRCDVCMGFGCIGELPGLGGVFENQNFQLNCEGWSLLRKKAEADSRSDELKNIKVSRKNLRCGPVTGAVENIGFAKEADFYFPYLQNAFQSGIGLCVGDGYPDEKLQLGVEAVRTLEKMHSCSKLNSKTDSGFVSSDSSIPKAAFFLKPYPDKILFERIALVRPFANFIGIDIDSFNILTMRNLVNLERKTATQLKLFRQKTGLPFVIKGVFTDADLELVKEVRPDVVYISNHGGRVETRIGSTAEFLHEHADELKGCCKEIWVDGGIRCKADVQTALFYGASQVIIARPFIRATYDNCYDQTIKDFL